MANHQPPTYLRNLKTVVELMKWKMRSRMPTMTTRRSNRFQPSFLKVVIQRNVREEDQLRMVTVERQ